MLSDELPQCSFYVLDKRTAARRLFGAGAAPPSAGYSAVDALDSLLPRKRSVPIAMSGAVAPAVSAARSKQ